MGFEYPQNNKSAENIGESSATELISEVEALFEDGFPDEEAHQSAVSSLRTARLLSFDSATKSAIDRILDEIESRYGRI